MARDEITLLTTSGLRRSWAQQSGLIRQDSPSTAGRSCSTVAGWARACAVFFGTVASTASTIFRPRDRSSLYALALSSPAGPPEVGLGLLGAARIRTPILGRYPQHTIDKQAEQLLMAGIQIPRLWPGLPGIQSRPLPAKLRTAHLLLLLDI